MAEATAPLTYTDWLTHVFDHPVADPAWYFSTETGHWDETADPRLTLRYVTRLFSEPEAALEPYDDARIAQGLYYLIDTGASCHVLTLFDRRAPLPERVGCLAAMATLFERLFAPRCADVLGHLDEPGARPLNMVCYMWWDVLPLAPAPQDRERAALDNAALDVMAACLRLNSEACQESALHGLGHWQQYYPARITRLIDDFLAANPALRQALRQYALSARRGCVL